jgi:hypothetical protein
MYGRFLEYVLLVIFTYVAFLVKLFVLKWSCAASIQVLWLEHVRLL